MSFDHLKSVWRSVGVRLTVGYVVLLVLSIGLLYALALWQLQRVLQRRDRGRIEVEWNDLAAEYARGGIDALRDEAEEDTGVPLHVPSYARLVDADGRVLFAEPEGAWPPATLAVVDRRALPEEGGWRHLSHDGAADLEVLTRVLPGGAVLQVGGSTEARREAVDDFQAVFALAALPVLVLGLLAGAFVARNVLRPLRELADVTRRISTTGEVTRRVPQRDTGDELDALALLFNRMLDRIVRLLDGMRDTLDNVAHDLRTPMTRLRGRNELVLQAPDATGEDYREALADGLEASEQVLTMLDTIMDVAEAGAGTLPLQRERVALKTLADEVVDLYAYVAEEKNLQLEAHGDGDVMAHVDPGRMRQVIANLVDNAVKYTPDGGAVVVDVFREEDAVGFEVCDTGAGIADEDLPHIWDRLYRGDRSRTERGLGLGLSLVQAVVRAHGGRVSARNAPSGGAVFIVSLPVTPAS